MGNNFSKERTDAFSISVNIFSRNYDAVIFSKFATTGYLFSVTSAGLIQFILRNTATSNEIFVRSLVSIPNKRWCDVVVTYDGSSTAAGVKIYVDGAQIAMSIVSNTLSSTIVNSEPARIGSFNGTASSWNGFITDTILHDAELTPAEVADLHFDNIATHVQARWPFLDGAGSTLTASVGGVDGTITGATWSNYTPSNFGPKRVTPHSPAYSLIYPAASGVSMGNNFAKERTDAFSISTWCWVDRDAPATGVIASKLASNVGWYVSLPPLGSAAKQVFARFSNTFITNEFRVISKATIASSQWFHLVMTYDGSSNGNGVNFYLNGELMLKSIVLNTLSSSILNSANFNVGAIAVSSNNFRGRLSDFRLHNAELTPQQVEDLYTMNKAVAVQAHWPFTDGTGTTLTATAGGVNGSITGATWSDYVPPNFEPNP
jgi:hypothetical protein